MFRRTLVSMVVCALACCVAWNVALAQQPVKQKKLIEYGWDVPNPDYVRKNIREMEKLPFDGVIFRVPKVGISSQKTSGTRRASSRSLKIAGVLNGGSSPTTSSARIPPRRWTGSAMPTGRPFVTTLASSPRQRRWPDAGASASMPSRMATTPGAIPPRRMPRKSPSPNTRLWCAGAAPSS